MRHIVVTLVFALPVAMTLALGGCASVITDPDFHQKAAWDNFQWRQNVLLEDKVRPAPEALMKHLGKQNEHDGFPERPSAMELPKDFEADMKAALRELPAEIQNLINPKLLGIIVVKTLGGSAFSNPIMDPDQRPVSGYVVLDYDSLNNTANAWASWKENSPFRKDSELRVELKIEEPAQDNRKQAIQFILLHEFGHILGFQDPRAHPTMFKTPKELGSFDGNAFAKLTWSIVDDRVVSRFEKDYPSLAKVPFYQFQASPVRTSAIPAVYAALAKTSFASLYGSTSYFDDFAEAFATYVHTILMKKPYRAALMDGKKKKPLATYGTCWNEARCREKRRLLEEILTLPRPPRS